MNLIVIFLLVSGFLLLGNLILFGFVVKNNRD